MMVRPSTRAGRAELLGALGDRLDLVLAMPLPALGLFASRALEIGRVPRFRLQNSSEKRESFGSRVESKRASTFRAGGQKGAGASENTCSHFRLL